MQHLDLGSGSRADRQTHSVVHLWRERRRTSEEDAQLAVEQDPDSAHAWEALGSILAERGELLKSSQCFETAIRLAPNLVSVKNNLAVALQHLGRLGEAEVCYRQALQLAPENLEILLNFGSLLGEMGRRLDGLEVVEQILDRDPSMVRALLLASALESGAGRYMAALAWIERAIAVEPARTESLTLRAELFCQLGRFDAALEDCERVLEKVPNHAQTLHIMALALQGLDRPLQALDAYRSAEAAKPTAPAAIVADRAWLLAEMGRKEEALEALDHALQLQPDLTVALSRRAHLTRNDLTDSDIAAMESLADSPGRPLRDRVSLCFALGQAYLDMGDGERAFARLGMGNRLMRSTLEYDPDSETRRFAAIATALSASDMSRLLGSGEPEGQPIFVFGMPRSGTTLVEQILASHPGVRGAGETTHLSDIVDASGVLDRAPRSTPGELAEVGHRYLDLVGADTHGTLRIVDKMTWNFLYAGLIPLILPGARMIHCRRDPLDTCLSCYSTLFTRGHEYSYNLAELGHFYRLYEQLMAHWRRVLPAGSLLEIEYETLVDDTEGEVRRLLDFCSLTWDPACLRFHETRRRVATASLDQVRTPVYKTSVGRAQVFRPWLEQLEAALEGLPAS